MSKQVGIGVIGIGMGLSLAAVNQDEDSELEVRAICGSRADRVAAAVQQTGVRFGTTDYRELIARPDVHVVAVFSPDHLHAIHARAALEAGKHVMCTKPMVTSVDDASDLVRLVDQTGLRFMVGQTMRFEPEFATAMQMYSSGQLGEIAWAESHYVHDLRHVYEQTPWRLSVPQDPLFGGLSHPIDFLRWFFGDIRRVHAFGRMGVVTPQNPRIDNFLVNLEFESGTMARCVASFGIVHPPGTMMGLGLYGSQGSLKADYTDMAGGTVRSVLDAMPGNPIATIPFQPETTGAYGHGETVRRMLAVFERALATGEQPTPDVRDGAKSIATCSAVRDSIETGQVVDVANDF